MATSRVDSSQLDALPSRVDTTGDVNKFAATNSSGKLILPSVAGQTVIGVITEGAAAGKPATYQNGGIAKVIAGEAIDSGEEIMTNDVGLAVVATGAGSVVAGVALTAAAAAGEMVEFNFHTNRVPA